MQTHSLHLWGLRLATFLLAALAAASAAFWVLKWIATAAPGPSAALLLPAPPAADAQAVARLLGGGQTVAAAAPQDDAASRFKLLGVVADRAKGGTALISIDAKPARPYRVGSRVNDTLVLHSVTARGAALAPSLDAPVAFTLELPKLSPP